MDVKIALHNDKSRRWTLRGCDIPANLMIIKTFNSLDTHHGTLTFQVAKCSKLPGRLAGWSELSSAFSTPVEATVPQLRHLKCPSDPRIFPGMFA